MFCFEDSWRKKRIGKKAEIRRGWGAYEEGDGIRRKRKGGEGEEIQREKMYLGWKSGLGKRSFIVTDD
jgi:hypothetical protein